MILPGGTTPESTVLRLTTRSIGARLALFIVFFGLTSATVGPASADVLGDESIVTSQLNGLRSSLGLPSLVTDARLVAIARNWSAHMASTDTLAHNAGLAAQSPAGDQLKENVGFSPTALGVHQAFVASPSHYAVMTSPGPTAVGVGAVRVNGMLWVTQVYLRPVTLEPMVSAASGGGSSGGGYRAVSADGNVASFGDTAAIAAVSPPVSPVVGGSATPTGDGLWMVSANGAVIARGDAPVLGGMSDQRLSAPIVGMAATPTGRGYWLLGRDGGIFSFGVATFFGSTGDIRLNQPVVAMTASPSGGGYWFVAADGGIFSFGDAAFVGSTGNIRLNQPVVGMASTPSGGGYWLVARDGGIFAFGNATFLGSTGHLALVKPIVGMATSPSGSGYRFVAADGGVFSFGDASFLGSMAGSRIAAPVVALLAA